MALQIESLWTSVLLFCMLLLEQRTEKTDGDTVRSNGDFARQDHMKFGSHSCLMLYGAVFSCLPSLALQTISLKMLLLYHHSLLNCVND